jgi:CPA1 family monovalent cation:H+ antiporter
MAGMEAICANILNEHVQEDLPLSGIGRMMAMTQNDEVNSLAIRECRSLFDRSHLFQLSFNVANTHHRRGMTKNLMGRELFGKGMTFSVIRELHQLGATFKATPLSDAFTFDSFRERYGSSPKLLCAVDENGKLLLNTVDDPLQPEAGQTIITLVTSTTVPDDHAALTSQSDS